MVFMKRKLIIISIVVFYSSALSQRVVGYYPHWVLSQLQPEEIEFDIVTHVIHSFAWANEDGSISSYEGMFGNNIADLVHSGNSKILLSIGGWGNHEGFEAVILNEELREMFIYNLTSVLLINNYDGVDLDWEFPNSNDDKNHLNLLVSEMDSIFNSINPNWLITMAIPVSNWWGQWYDFDYLNNHIDFYNAMTYGTHGNWSSHVGHLSPLYSSPLNDPDGSCHLNMNYLINQRGIPKERINMGIPFWGAIWNASNINESFTGEISDIMFYEIPVLINNGWNYNWDTNAMCPYLINDDSTQVITYENQQSVAMKCEYVLNNEIGGVMIWALSYDNTEFGQELLASINENYLSNINEEKNLYPAKIFINTYPNPFNPICHINFYLNTSTFLEIVIFDITGQKIKLLNSKYFKEGSHVIDWNAEKLSSGIYFISFKSNNKLFSKKVMLLK